MAKKKKNNQEDEILVDVTAPLSKAEKFFEENKNVILGAVIGIVVIAGSIVGYNKFILEPKEKSAQYELYLAQNLLDIEDFNGALNGDGEGMGLLEIVREYKGTKSGNLANYYIGVSYLNLGDYKEAIRYLDKFSTKDEILSVISTGAIGDAFMELNQPKEALEYYEKAARKSNNSFVVPIYLDRAGQTAMMLGDNKKALQHYKRLVKDFKEAQEAQEAEKIIAKLEASN
jgi:tetratricopeptide (TPR) repeat protein